MKTACDTFRESPSNDEIKNRFRCEVMIRKIKNVRHIRHRVELDVSRVHCCIRIFFIGRLDDSIYITLTM